jgi:hypothetical protein
MSLWRGAFILEVIFSEASHGVDAAIDSNNASKSVAGCAKGWTKT